MPARVIPNNEGNNKKGSKATKAQVKAPQVVNEDSITKEMEAVLAESVSQTVAPRTPSGLDRVEFYAGKERLDLQGESVKRVRELQEENDHLQREISAKEEELASCTDPLSILADVEHRKIIIARNTGEILKIYLRNEERIKRIKELESHNAKIQSEMMEMQGRFITTKSMDDKTKFASEFFVLKSQIERNLQEISTLNQK